jgi:hypothetical protein
MEDIQAVSPSVVVTANDVYVAAYHITDFFVSRSGADTIPYVADFTSPFVNNPTRGLFIAHGMWMVSLTPLPANLAFSMHMIGIYLQCLIASLCPSMICISMHNGVGKMPTISLRTIILLLIVLIVLTGAPHAQDNERRTFYYSDWSADGSTIAVATISMSFNELTIYNADLSVRSRWQQSGQDSRRRFFGLSPNGDRILTEGEVWDTRTFQPTLITPDYYFGDWSADGTLILATPKKSELGFVTLSSATGEIVQSYLEGIYNIGGPI